MLAQVFGVDALLGAFVGGVVLNVADNDDRPTQERYVGKLHAIGYGFLVPVFFVVPASSSTCGHWSPAGPRWCCCPRCWPRS
ncbi:MAG: cation:proton antiporter [Streptosporangiaceae bacterium]